MKIAYLSRAHAIHRSGAQRFHHELILPILSKMGHDVVLFTAEAKVGHKTPFAEPYIVKTIKGTDSNRFTLRLLMGFRREIGKNQFDVVISSSWSGLLLKKSRTRVIHFFHNSWSTMRPIEQEKNLFSKTNPIPFSKFWQRMVWNIRATIILKRQCEIVFPSYYVLRAFESDTKLLKKVFANPMMRVVYNPVSSETSANCSSEAFHTFDKSINLGFLGRLSPQKGISHLFEVIEFLEQQLAERITMHVAGPIESRQYQSELRERLSVSEKKLSKSSICFCGPIPSRCTIDFFKNLDLALFPSLFQEGFSLALLEALVSGTPVLAYKSGGNSEALAFGRFGDLVDQGDLRGLKDSALKILINYQPAKEKAMLAKEHIRARFVPEVHLETLLSSSSDPDLTLEFVVTEKEGDKE